MAVSGARVLWSGLVLVLLYMCLSIPGATAEPETATQSDGKVGIPASSPLCHNNGSLVWIESEGHYICNCTGTGYKGPKCEEAMTVCDNQPCQNGGTCTLSGETAKNYSCDCRGTGYKGPTCEEGPIEDHCIPRPDHPFKVVWNFPDECDKDNDTILPLEEFGFTFNKDREFLGEEILTLYKSETGKWPSMKDCEKIHGGVPQGFDDKSYNETRADMQRIRVSNFTGIGCVAFNDWRAVYDTNLGPDFELYWATSLVLERKKRLTYNITVVHRDAKENWEEGAKNIMLKKLEIAQELMPDGRWGYQEYPRAWSGDLTETINNKMAWLWSKATGLYPVIFPIEFQQDENVISVRNRLQEAVRIQSKFSPPNTDIYPYIKIRERDEKIFRDPKFLNKTFTLSANLGAAGVILWGPSALHEKGRLCTQMKKDIRNTLGPFVQNLTTKMLNCSNQLCNGNGRCVLTSDDVLLTQDKCDRSQKFSDYHCRCYGGYSGACCQTFLQASPCHKR